MMVELANIGWLPKDIYRSARRIELLRQPAVHKTTMFTH
jgi:hypothetical protein